MRRLLAALGRNPRLSRNVLGTVVVRGLSVLAGLATMPAYLRFFPDRAVLGAWFTILSVFNIVVFFDLGVGNGLRTRIVKPLTDGDYDLVRRLIASTYAVSAALAVVAFAGGAAAISQLDWNDIFDTPTSVVAPDHFRSVLLVLLVGIVLQLLLKNTSSILYALQRNNIANLLSLVPALILLVILLVVGTGSLPEDLMRLSIANVLVNTLPAIAATVWLFRSGLVGSAPLPRHVDLTSVRAVLGVGSMFLGIQLGLVVINSTDPILISALSSPRHVVDYQAYIKIFGLISMMFSLLTQPVWSAVAAARARADFAWIGRAASIMIRLAALGAAFSLVVVVALPWIFATWLGEGVIETSYLTALAFAALAITDMFTLAVTCIANGIGELRVQLVFTLVGALVKVPLVWLFFILSWGWVGVILAHALVLVPLVVMQALELRSRLRPRPPADRDPTRQTG